MLVGDLCVKVLRGHDRLSDVLRSVSIENEYLPDGLTRRWMVWYRNGWEACQEVDGCAVAARFLYFSCVHFDASCENANAGNKHLTPG